MFQKKSTIESTSEPMAKMKLSEWSDKEENPTEPDLVGKKGWYREPNEPLGFSVILDWIYDSYQMVKMEQDMIDRQQMWGLNYKYVQCLIEIRSTMRSPIWLSLWAYMDHGNIA